MKKTNDSLSTNRRNFLKASGTAAAAAGAISFPTVTFGKPDSRKLKIGCIGCGGRGTGAAAQALNADSNVELWAMGDVFKQNLDRSLANVRRGRAGKINVDDTRKFVGLDAYAKVLESGVVPCVKYGQHQRGRRRVRALQAGEPIAGSTSRYGWADNPVVNLVNRHGLPAAPFRTDDW